MEDAESLSDVDECFTPWILGSVEAEATDTQTQQSHTPSWVEDVLRPRLATPSSSAAPSRLGLRLQRLRRVPPRRKAASVGGRVLLLLQVVRHQRSVSLLCVHEQSVQHLIAPLHQPLPVPGQTLRFRVLHERPGLPLIVENVEVEHAVAHRPPLVLSDFMRRCETAVSPRPITKLSDSVSASVLEPLTIVGELISCCVWSRGAIGRHRHTALCCRFLMRLCSDIKKPESSAFHRWRELLPCHHPLPVAPSQLLLPSMDRSAGSMLSVDGVRPCVPRPTTLDEQFAALSLCRPTPSCGLTVLEFSADEHTTVLVQRRPPTPPLLRWPQHAFPSWTSVRLQLQGRILTPFVSNDPAVVERFLVAPAGSPEWLEVEVSCAPAHAPPLLKAASLAAQVSLSGVMCTSIASSYALKLDVFSSVSIMSVAASSSPKAKRGVVTAVSQFNANLIRFSVCGFQCNTADKFTSCPRCSNPNCRVERDLSTLLTVDDGLDTIQLSVSCPLTCNLPLSYGNLSCGQTVSFIEWHHFASGRRQGCTDPTPKTIKQRIDDLIESLS